MFKSRITTGAIFTALALVGIMLLSGCGNLQQPLGPDRTVVAQKGSSGKATVSPKAAKVVTKKAPSSTSLPTTIEKEQVNGLSTYSLGDDNFPPEPGP